MIRDRQGYPGSLGLTQGQTSYLDISRVIRVIKIIKVIRVILDRYIPHTAQGVNVILKGVLSTEYGTCTKEQRDARFDEEV